MTKIQFHKYVAAGNDFIMVNNWQSDLKLSRNQIAAICARRTGIGADGLILLSPDTDTDFRMNYFNADGSRGEMCGNGARSLVMFAESQGKANSNGVFLADDGPHAYHQKKGAVDVEIRINDRLHAREVPRAGCFFINTGVPHLIVPVHGLATQNLDRLGQAMNSHIDHPQGTNVDLVEKTDNGLEVRTWERGVNQETLACGTGAAATAIFANQVWDMPWPVSLRFKGGVLKVDLQGNQYWLSGPAKLVFVGHISLSMLNDHEPHILWQDEEEPEK